MTGSEPPLPPPIAELRGPAQEIARTAYASARASGETAKRALEQALEVAAKWRDERVPAEQGQLDRRWLQRADDDAADPGDEG